MSMHGITQDKAMDSLRESRNDLAQGKKTDLNLMGGFEDMMQLAVASIQYQDPLQPKDASEFAQNFFTMAQAQGLNDIKTGIEKQNTLLSDMQLLQASSQVGRDVEMEGNYFTRQENTPVDLNFLVPNGVSKAVLSVVDKKGRAIHTHTFTPEAGKASLDATKMSYEWDGKSNTLYGDRVSGPNGKVPVGEYAFKVAVFDAKGGAIQDPHTQEKLLLPTSVTGTISGGRKTLSGTMLQMGDSSYPLANLISIQEGKTKNPEELARDLHSLLSETLSK